MKYRAVAISCFALSLAAAPALACFTHESCPSTDSYEFSVLKVPAAAQRAFAQGNYLLAANIAEGTSSATALAFAARARTADAITRDTPCMPCLVDAEAAAASAIKSDPNLAEGYVQLAVAIGFRGRLLGAVEAQSEGLAEKGRAAIDRALELDPLNVWARASLGGWHLEVVRRAGPFLASTMYGASEREGLKVFRAALAEAPAIAILHFHYALSILALDADRFHGEALIALETAEQMKVTDALTRSTRDRAVKLMDALQRGTPEEIEMLVRKFQGYPPES